MIENQVILAKTGGLKLLGAVLVPSLVVGVLGGVVAWKVWSSVNLVKLHNKDKKTDQHLARLMANQRKLQQRLIELEKQQAQPTPAAPVAPVAVAAVSEANTASRPTTDPRKRSLLKRLLEDNLKLRKSETVSSETTPAI
jgi:hypothetical protein